MRQAALGQKSAASFIRRTQLIGCSVVGGAKCLTLTEEKQMTTKATVAIVFGILVIFLMWVFLAVVAWT